MRHAALPQKKTIEELALWLTENAVDKRTHTQNIDLTDKDRHEHEVKITLATAAIYDLQALEKTFKRTIRKGTNSILDNDFQPQFQPETFTIPPQRVLTSWRKTDNSRIIF